jgi:DNA repair protein SbcC/Rad50
MKILKLTICNLASIAGETVIDFTTEPLSTAGIFAITGPTGSGKSTILDAMCLALFGNTPRLAAASADGAKILDISGEPITQNNSKNILRKNCAQGYAELDFVGSNKKKYKAKWEIKRSFNKADGKINTPINTLFDYEKNEQFEGKLAETQKEIVTVLGLTFDQFCKSVLLAQGDFSTFLKAKESEKAELLEKLTGTEIYRKISKNIFDKCKSEKEKKAEMQKELNANKVLTEDEVQELENNIAINKVTELENTSSITALEKQKNWYETNTVLDIDITQAEQNYNTCKKEEELNKDNKIILETIVALQPLQPKIIDVEHDQTKQKTAILELQQLETEGKIIHQQYIHSIATRDQIVKNKSKADLAFTTAKPLIASAKELDINIKKEIQNKNKQATTVTEDEQILNSTTTEWNEAKKIVAQQLQQKQTLEKWLQDNENLKTIALHKDVIVEQLNVLSATIVKYNTLETEQQKNLDKKNKLIINEKSYTQNIEKNTTRITETETKIITQQQLLLANDLTEINTNIRTSDNTIHATQQLLKTIQCIQTDTLEVNKNQIQLLETQSKITALETSQQQLQKEIENNRLLHAAQLKHIKDLEKINDVSIASLRSMLLPGEPCCVCGSTTHVYEAMHQISNETLENAKIECNATARLIETNNALLTQHIIDYATATTTVTNLLSLIQSKTKSIVQNNIVVADAKKQLNIDVESIAELQTILQQLQHEVKNLEARKQIAENANQQYTLLKNKQQQLYDEQKQNETNLQICVNDVANIMTLQKKMVVDIEAESKVMLDTKNKLAVHFINENWFENFVMDNENFKNKIVAVADDWDRNTNQYTDLEKNITKQNNDVEKCKQRFTLLQLNYIKSKNALDIIEIEIQTLKNRRNKIFEGKLIAEIEASFEQILAENIQAEKSNAEQLNKLEKEITILKTNIEHKKSELETLQKNIAEKNTGISDWITIFNKQHHNIFSLADIKPYFTYTTDWVKQQTDIQQKIKDNLVKTKTSLEERIARKNKHAEIKNGEDSFETILEKHTILLAQKNEVEKQKMELSFAKTNNENLLIKNKNILNTIAKHKPIHDAWLQLDDLIGSADGKRFTIIAQQYTLDYLLQYANIQLQQLANRYALSRIPDSLSLQIIDTEMGDEVRPVHSLSGGESFMVSLALALGLSSLSTNKMQIESLFIDEGFGSLDDKTLHTVMDALEKLQNQGRKVGVITHVQEMTQRIATQIKVTKANNGKSKVAVTQLYN